MSIFAPANFKKMNRIWTFIRNWTLPLAMLAGVAEYYVFVALPFGQEVHHLTYEVVAHYLQPFLLFIMLFLSFIKVSPKEMRPHWWQLWVLLVQAVCFILCSFLAMCMPDEGWKVLCEGAMLAFICPTATASAVVVGKLGGSVSGVVTYLMMCNLMVSLLAPAFLTLVELNDMGFFIGFLMILRKVMPLLVCPLLVAWFVRFCVKGFYRWLIRFNDLAFYVWAVSLSLAIAVTVRSIVHSSVGLWYMIGLAIISGVGCLLQFAIGKAIGGYFGPTERITAGQAFGQKNTVFVIWMGQVFLNPVTSVVGGFYSVWHNTVNSWQLYKKRSSAKSEIRTRMKKKIAEMPLQERERQSREVCKKIIVSPEFSKADNLLLYMALKDEVSLDALVAEALAQGKTVWLPVMVGNSLIVKRYEPSAMHVEDRFGISEPGENAAQLTDLKKIDLAIIPGRAFTRDGARLGRGKGFYDRMLTELCCPMWGVGFRWQMVSRIETDSWDVKLQKVLSAE